MSLYCGLCVCVCQLKIKTPWINTGWIVGILFTLFNLKWLDNWVWVFVRHSLPFLFHSTDDRVDFFFSTHDNQNTFLVIAFAFPFAFAWVPLNGEETTFIHCQIVRHVQQLSLNSTLLYSNYTVQNKCQRECNSQPNDKIVTVTAHKLDRIQNEESSKKRVKLKKHYNLHNPLNYN